MRASKQVCCALMGSRFTDYVQKSFSATNITMGAQHSCQDPDCYGIYTAQERRGRAFAECRTQQLAPCRPQNWHPNLRNCHDTDGNAHWPDCGDGFRDGLCMATGPICNSGDRYQVATCTYSHPERNNRLPNRPGFALFTDTVYRPLCTR